MGWDYSEDEKWNEENNLEKGPFYCGLSVVLIVSQANIRLCPPTSTSKQLAVATKFAGDRGMVIQFMNDGHVGSHMLRCFNCTWLSNYKEEEERLFIGGDWSIRVQSIRNIQTAQNFVKYFTALFHLDCMVSGTQLNDNVNVESQIGKKEYDTLNTLMKYKAKIDGFEKNLPRYVIETFEAFTNYKKQIVINPYCIQHGSGLLSNLIMESLTPIFTQLEVDNANNGNRFGFNNFKTYINNTLGEQFSNALGELVTNNENTTSPSINEFTLSIPNGKDNLFKPILFRIFNNIDHVVIFTTGFDGDPEYLINLDLLLSLLSNSEKYIANEFKLTIKATHKYVVCGEEWGEYEFQHVDTSWLSKLWNKSWKTIRAKYRKKRYDISYVKTTQILLGSYRLREDRLVIKRL
eukprot:516003_1